jgi:hypothetical protein
VQCFRRTRDVILTLSVRFFFIFHWPSRDNTRRPFASRPVRVAHLIRSAFRIGIRLQNVIPSTTMPCAAKTLASDLECTALCIQATSTLTNYKDNNHTAHRFFCDVLLLLFLNYHVVCVCAHSTLRPVIVIVYSSFQPSPPFHITQFIDPTAWIYYCIRNVPPPPYPTTTAVVLYLLHRYPSPSHQKYILLLYTMWNVRVCVRIKTLLYLSVTPVRP